MLNLNVQLGNLSFQGSIIALDLYEVVFRGVQSGDYIAGKGKESVKGILVGSSSSTAAEAA